MSVFTNPADRAGDAAARYVTALLHLLADRDPMSVLRATPGELRSTVAGLDTAAARRPEAEGKWSAAAVVQHLADSELVSGWRFRLILAQDRPELTGYDQDAWASRFRYDDVSLDHSLAQFDVLRASNLRMLDALDPGDLDRVGVHRERGEESAGHMVRLYAGHDLIHLAQLRRVLEKVR